MFQNKYLNKPYPRIIFPLQKANKYYEFNDTSYKNEIELDGCFFIKEKFTLKTDEFPFQFQYFKPCNFNPYSKWNNNNAYEFLPNDLCLIEIKTHFPEMNKNELYDSQYEKDFTEVINDFLDKTIIFEQLFRDMNLEYKRIKLILLYDVVKKKIMKKVLKKN